MLEPKILRYVLMVATEKNFSKAAQKLHVAQPSLSYQIIKLEKELGTQLFKRSHSEVQLTYAGKIFVKRAMQILDQVDQLKKEINDVVDMQTGQLLIGSLPTTGAFLLPKAIPIFQQNYPGIELVLLEDTTHNLELLVSQGQVEISLLSMPVLNAELEVETILEEEILLAVPRNHPFSKLREIQLSDCKDESFILQKRGIGFRSTCENLCMEAGFEPRIVFESINIDTCQSLVSVGMGITFVPKMVIRDYQSFQAPVYLPIKHSKKPIRNVVFAYKNGRYLSQAARAFIDIMKAAAPY